MSHRSKFKLLTYKLYDWTLATVLYIVEASQTPKYFLSPTRRCHPGAVMRKSCREQSPQGGKGETRPSGLRAPWPAHTPHILSESIWTLHLLRVMRNIRVLTGRGDHRQALRAFLSVETPRKDHSPRTRRPLHFQFSQGSLCSSC